MWGCKKGLEIRHLGGAERFKTAKQSAKVALETKKHQLYNVLWKVRDAKAQLYDVFSKVRETNIQLYNVFLEAGHHMYNLYFTPVLEGQRGQISISRMFLRVRKAKTQFYTDFLRKTTAGRPYGDSLGRQRGPPGIGLAPKLMRPGFGVYQH